VNAAYEAAHEYKVDPDMLLALTAASGSTEANMLKQTIPGWASLPQYLQESMGAYSPSSLASKLKSGQDIYGEHSLLAMVHARRPDYAARMADIDSLYEMSADELREVVDMLGGMQNLDQIPGAASQLSWLENRLAGVQQIVARDDEAVKQTAQDLADAWNLPGLSDGFLSELAGGFGGALQAYARAQLGNPFNPDMQVGIGSMNVPSDIGAFVEKRLRDTPEYEELFRYMREGESEEEYVRRFERESERVMGDDNVHAVRAGQRTGDVNTVGRNILASGAGYESSTFQERLARMADAFKRTT
jgi:hypothetical protein